MSIRLCGFLGKSEPLKIYTFFGSADSSKKTEGGKPIPEDAYQDRRQVANLLRALFLPGSTDKNNSSLYGSVKYQIQEIAATNPFSSVVDSLQTIVFEYFDKFKTASIVNDSDADQQSYFLNRYEEDYKKQEDDHDKQMAQVRNKADTLIKQIDQEEVELKCRPIRLQDGRIALQGDHGWYSVTEQVGLEKYSECLAQHGLSSPIEQQENGRIPLPLRTASCHRAFIPAG